MAAVGGTVSVVPLSSAPEPLKLGEVGTLGERSLSLGLGLLAMTLAAGPLQGPPGC